MPDTGGARHAPWHVGHVSSFYVHIGDVRSRANFDASYRASLSRDEYADVECNLSTFPSLGSFPTVNSYSNKKFRNKKLEDLRLY